MPGIDRALLDRYLAKQCTAEERERVERWLAEGRSNREQVTAAAAAFGAVPAGTQAEVWAALRSELEEALVPAAAPPRRRALVLRVAFAAGLVLVVGGAFVGRAILFRGPPGAEPAAPMRVARTPLGQRASFQLPDGTRVILGPGSALRHPVRFDARSRSVQLEGEAYFDVEHDERRPFVVRAGDVVAKDLGTSFAVRAYPEDRHARVVVREGRVAFRPAASDSSAARAIEPGQLGRLASDGSPLVEQADTSAYFAWTEGRLVFDGVPLGDALPQLSRWYDLEFRLADSSLGRVPLTATFKNQPTQDVLDLLAASLGIRQVQRGRVVTFYPARQNR